MTAAPLVAIVGCGPRGLHCLERLFDALASGVPASGVRVVVFEPHPYPGAGPAYDPRQPDYLRMNYGADQIDAWTGRSRAVPPAERLTFERWRGRGPDDEDAFPARATVGRYLCDCLEAVMRHRPPGVDVRVLPLRVMAIERDSGRWSVSADNGERVCADEVLLATGHGPSAGDEHRGWGHQPVFPVEEWMGPERIPPGATVAVRGFALTFIDAVLSLTEGRGGAFLPTGHPWRLRYVPSGEEPAAIVPHSRTGCAMRAKPGPLDEPGLSALAAQGRTIAEAAGLGEVVTAVGRAAASLLETTRDDRAQTDDRVGTALAARVAGMATQRTGAGRPAAAALMRSLDVAANLRSGDSDWALGSAWRGLYPNLVQRVGFGGLDTHERPGLRGIAAGMERLAFGPPPRSAARLVALAEHGLLRLDRLRAQAPPPRPVVEVDAVLPPPGPGGPADPLGASLLASGLMRRASGCRGAEITRAAACVGANGKPTPGLSVCGRATEDWVLGNDTLSRTLHDLPERWAMRVAHRLRAAGGQTGVPAVLAR